MSEIRTFHRIEDVDGAVWDAIAGQDVLCTHGWLRCVEACRVPVLKPTYFLLGDEGVAVCYRYVTDERSFTADDTLLGKHKPWANRMGLSSLPALVCSPFRAYGQHLLLSQSLSAVSRDATAARLLDGMEQWAQRERMPLMFVNMLDSESCLIRLLRERGYLQTLQSPLNYLDVTWGSFDEYRKSLNSMGRKMANKVQREIRTNEEAGVSIERLTDITPLAEQFFALGDAHYYRLNGKPFPFSAEFFESMKRYLSQESIVYGAFRQDELKGAVIVLHRNSVGYIHMIGVNRDNSGNDFTYFNLAFYRPIRDAIKNGLRRIYYGNSLDQMKRRRGCRTTRTYLFYRPDTLLRKVLFRPLIGLHARRAERKVPAWAEKHQPII